MILQFIRLIVAATSILIPLNGFASTQGTVEAATEPLPFVSPIFGDNMVLQRGKANTIWGWSGPGDKVRVEIGEATASSVAGADRRWQVTILPPPTGGPYTIRITGHESVELHNVLVGDVWLCGGQSNMQFALLRVGQRIGNHLCSEGDSGRGSDNGGDPTVAQVAKAWGRKSAS